MCMEFRFEALNGTCTESTRKATEDDGGIINRFPGFKGNDVHASTEVPRPFSHHRNGRG